MHPQQQWIPLALSHMFGSVSPVRYTVPQWVTGHFTWLLFCLVNPQPYSSETDEWVTGAGWYSSTTKVRCHTTWISASQRWWQRSWTLSLCRRPCLSQRGCQSCSPLALCYDPGSQQQTFMLSTLHRHTQRADILQSTVVTAETGVNNSHLSATT